MILMIEIFAAKKKVEASCIDLTNVIHKSSQETRFPLPLRLGKNGFEDYY